MGGRDKTKNVKKSKIYKRMGSGYDKSPLLLTVIIPVLTCVTRNFKEKEMYTWNEACSCKGFRDKTMENKLMILQIP